MESSNRGRYSAAREIRGIAQGQDVDLQRAPHPFDGRIEPVPLDDEPNAIGFAALRHVSYAAAFMPARALQVRTQNRCGLARHPEICSARRK
jgi:hypothetical protein